MDNLIQYEGNGRPKLIAWFDDFGGPNEYDALSNFYIADDPIVLPYLGGDEFQTGEHAFQAMKAYRGRKTHDYKKIRDASSPDEAKAFGRTCRLRDDWESVKYDVMMAILRAKFTFDRREGEILLQTGAALLVEGTYWNDTVWGVALHHTTNDNPLTAPGRNWLGTLLMARRAEMKAQGFFETVHPTQNYNMEFAT